MTPMPTDARLNYGPMRMLLYRTAPTLTVMSDLLPDKLAGVYIRSSDTIIIDRRMSYTRKRCTLVHELVHRHYGDDTSQGPCGQYAEQRCRRETARLLVGLTDYITAEHAYDGIIEPMADMLNVSKQIVIDFQQLVIPTLDCQRLVDQDF